MSAQIFWYAARASGIVAWALAAVTVIWGLALSTRMLGRRPRPAWLFDLHRFLGGLTLSFTSVHMLAVVADSYVHISLANVLVPLTGTWHPLPGLPARRGHRLRPGGHPHHGAGGAIYPPLHGCQPESCTANGGRAPALPDGPVANRLPPKLVHYMDLPETCQKPRHA